MDIKELNKAIDEVNGNAAKLGERYQEVALLVLEHVGKHGDIGPANRLYLGMPKSQRRLVMGQWLIKFGKVKANADRATMQTMPLVFDKAKETNMEGAKAQKWWEVQAEREITDVFDLQVAVKSLLNRAKDKTIKVGGQAMAPDAAKQTLKTIALLAGLPVPNVEVDDKGVTHMPTDGKVGDTVNPGPAVTDGTAAAEAAKAAAKAVEAAAAKPSTAKREEKASARKGAGKPNAPKNPTRGRATA